MKIISKFTPVQFREISVSLVSGNLVAFPTETVYGLGADANNELAVKKIFEVKGRPLWHPLIVHIYSIHDLDYWVSNIPKYALKIANQFWPGPLTLILPRTNLAKDFITGGQENVGIRVPSHAIARKLLFEFKRHGGKGIAAPSANRFGKVSPTSASDVVKELSKYLHLDDVIIDGGRSKVGLESTILDCTQEVPMILRPGAITESMIKETIGVSLRLRKVGGMNNLKFPGSVNSHYAPKARVYLSGIPKPGDGFIALAKFETPKGAIRLAKPKTNIEYAYVLYNAFRIADETKIKNVFVVPPNGDEMSIAIRDRLEKAEFKE